MSQVPNSPLEVTQKAWGYEELIVNNAQYCGKFLVIAPRQRCSLHLHPIKRETFIPIFGEVMIERQLESGAPSVIQKIHSGDKIAITIKPGTPHRFWSANPNQPAVLIEISTPHDDNDVVRLEESGPLPFGE